VERETPVTDKGNRDSKDSRCNIGSKIGRGRYTTVEAIKDNIKPVLCVEDVIVSQ
jgi:hypothetical protein